MPAFAPRFRSPNWQKQNPAIYKQFIETCDRLEDHYKDMQDIEFTIEHNKLFMLQCRSRQAHRSGRRAVSP